MGAVKTEDHDLMRFFSGLMDTTLNGEMLIHKAYMKRLDITPEDIKNSRRFRTMLIPLICLKSLMRAMHWIFIAVLACSWSYAYIGTKIAKIPKVFIIHFTANELRAIAVKTYVTRTTT